MTLPTLFRKYCLIFSCADGPFIDKHLIPALELVPEELVDLELDIPWSLSQNPNQVDRPLADRYVQVFPALVAG